MKIRRENTPKAAPARSGDRRARSTAVREDKPPRRRPAPASGRQERRRPAEAPPRERRAKNARVSGPAREQRPQRHGPATAPMRKQAPAKNTSQAKARAKARKAKAPKIARVPLKQRLLVRLTRLAEIDLRPQRLAARVPFVVLIIGALGLGLGVTLWLSTDAAERSYQLGHARSVNQGLLQQKEALEREVLERPRTIIRPTAVDDQGFTIRREETPEGEVFRIVGDRPTRGCGRRLCSGATISTISPSGGASASAVARATTTSPPPAARLSRPISCGARIVP